MIDKTRLQQILINLLTNAIKFSHSQGFVKVVVEVNLSKESRQQVELSV